MSKRYDTSDAADVTDTELEVAGGGALAQPPTQSAIAYARTRPEVFDWRVIALSVDQSWRDG